MIPWRQMPILMTLVSTGVALAEEAAPEEKPGPSPTARECPIPQPAVTARDYNDYAQTYMEPILPNPKHGIYAPRHGLSALAAYHFTKDRKYAEALLEAMRDYDAAIQQQIQENQGVHYSWEGPYLWGLILRELRQDQWLTPDDEAFAKEMFLRLAEHLSSWSPTLNYTRGQQHRAQGEAAARALAVFWYPDCPQAQKWKEYAEMVWNDWWQFRDIGINDTGYFYGALQRVLLSAELMGREEVWQDPAMSDFWERLMVEVAPDGSTIPYGASSGWNSAVGDRLLAMELAARHTGDGRYRWVAHRMLNYLRARGSQLKLQHHVFATTVEPIALAAVLADDRIPPVQPDAASRILYRKEVTRLTDEQARQQYPGYGILDCNMGMTQRVLPHKVLFRSGWNPGDLFMMVEAYTCHDPLNPTAILGLNRYGSALTIMSSEKFVSRENEVQIEDPTKAATYCGQKGFPGDRALPTGYAGMECTVEPFLESPLTTYARLRVTNYLGFEVEQTREFLFIKNRFILVRDQSRFREGFPCRIGPVWNTQTLEKQGPHWVNCYFDKAASLPPAYFENPRWDLLVYHAPTPGRKLEITPREGDLVQFTAPHSTRYVWEGQTEPGSLVQFSWLLLPHDPAQDAAALAGGIEFLKDEPRLLVVRHDSAVPRDATIVADYKRGREEWVLLNEDGQSVVLDSQGLVKQLATDARRLYLDYQNGQAARYWAHDATFLEINGAEVFRRPTRREVTVGEVPE